MLNEKIYSKNTLTICYKLLHDSLFMLIIFFTLTLIAEAVLPGIIISHIGFSKIIIALLLNIFILNILAKKVTPNQVNKNIYPKNNNLKKIIVIFSALGALLILNSQLGMNIFLNLFLLLICAILGYLSYGVLFD